MKKLMIFKLVTLLIITSMLAINTSCSSDNSGDSPQNITIIGKWHNYKRVENGVTYPDTGSSPISNLNYEFQANACIITEEGSTKNYIYKVDGDYIKFYNPNTEVLTGSERIISLSKDELVVENQYNSAELKYFKRL